MDFLSGVFGDPVQPAVKLIVLTLILVFVLLLIFWIFRRFVGSPAIKAARGRQPRLAVTDAANLDDKRRLVLVRRDDVEHLVMIGGTTDILIESNIVRIKPVRAPSKPATLEEEIAAMPVQSNKQTPDEQQAIPSNVTPSADDRKFNTQLMAGAASVAGVAGAIVSTNQTSTPDTQEIASPQNIQPEPIPSQIQPEMETPETGLNETTAVAIQQIPSPEMAQRDTAQPEFVEQVPVAENTQTDPIEQEFVAATLQDPAQYPAQDPAPEPAITPPHTTIEAQPDEIDTAALSNLEDALGLELSDEQLADDVITTTPARDNQVQIASTDNTAAIPEPESTKAPKPAMEDEMQKLLDELSGEKPKT